MLSILPQQTWRKPDTKAFTAEARARRKTGNRRVTVRHPDFKAAFLERREVGRSCENAHIMPIFRQQPAIISANAASTENCEPHRSTLGPRLRMIRILSIIYSDPHSNESVGAQLLLFTAISVVPIVRPFTNGERVAQNSPCGFTLGCES